MKTDETEGEYVTDQEVADAMEMLGKGYGPSAIIERPRKAHGINDRGLAEYSLSGWVKMSAGFCKHIRKLRGAKLSIWLCLALNINEDGECSLTQKEICELTDYSHTEVIDSVSELSEMGFLSVDRSGKKNLYKPIFVSRGKGNSPIVKKLDSTPADSLESSPAREKIRPTSSKKEQEGAKRQPDLVDGILKYTLSPKAIQDAMAKHFKMTPRWEGNKTNREWMQWAMDNGVTPEQIETAANRWRSDKLFNWSQPSLPKIQEHWLELISGNKPAADRPSSSEWRTLNQ